MFVHKVKHLYIIAIIKKRNIKSQATNNVRLYRQALNSVCLVIVQLFL